MALNCKYKFIGAQRLPTNLYIVISHLASKKTVEMHDNAEYQVYHLLKQYPLTTQDEDILNSLAVAQFLSDYYDDWKDKGASLQQSQRKRKVIPMPSELHIFASACGARLPYWLRIELVRKDNKVQVICHNTLNGYDLYECPYNFSEGMSNSTILNCTVIQKTLTDYFFLKRWDGAWLLI